MTATDADITAQYWTGVGFINFLESVINDYNRCFYKLIKDKELFTAYPLIRLQADNLRYIVAEYYYPDKILPNIYGRGRELNQIEIDGKQLKQSDINNLVEGLFTGYKKIWKKYSHYVHPSIHHAYYKCISENYKPVEPEDNTPSLAERDMVFINQCIVDTMLMIMDRCKSKLDKEQKKQYKEIEKEANEYLFKDFY